MIVRLSSAVAVFLLALDGGSYSLVSRTTLAIGVWWTIVVALGLALLPLARPPRHVFVTGGLLAGFAALTAASMAWAPSAEKAFIEFDRVSLYLGVYALTVLITTRATAAMVSDGIAIGIVGVGLLALGGRFFPDLLPAGELPSFLPSAHARLNYPVNYWNGLAILVALAVPLLLRAAVAAGSPFRRAFALSPLPALAAVVYLASSRGGVGVAFIAAAAFVVLTSHRWTVAAAVTVAGLGSAGAIAVLLARPELVDQPETTEAAAQGKSAAVLILLACTLTGGVYGLGGRYLPRPRRIRPVVGWVAAIAVVVLLLAGIGAVEPGKRFKEFKRPPTELTLPQQDFVRTHLLSGGGSGRWQFWRSAVDQFETRPVLGRGAGSYEAWWAEHATFSHFIRDAHSLYLEVLGELGLVGFALIVAALGSGLVAAALRLGENRDQSSTLAGLTAAFLGYVVAAGIDWVWEVTVVSIVGAVLLGLVTGPATAKVPAAPIPSTRESVGRSRARIAAVGAALAAGWLLVCSQAIPLLTHVKIRESESAAAHGRVADAAAAALSARDLQPWAASPYLQLALVEEQMGNVRDARSWIGEAIERDDADWRLWLVRARLETELGRVPEARRSLAHAVRLNPRSPLFAGLRR
jgi:O-Antigen ligase